MTVLGTAGHVDHGKTALVHALTGVDTDRLPEEKRRGITIELGFAPLVLTGMDHVISLVDVPGHESFVGTMASGAHGLDGALLVVAADAGVMPQTREHLAILSLLRVTRIVVALSRCDLADADMRLLARLEVDELFGEFGLVPSAVVETSSVTGEGLEPLRSALAVLAKGRQRDASRPVRLPIDRVFSPRGQGTVVTGTLVDGVIEVGQELSCLSPYREGPVRVRGLQVFHQARQRVAAGERVAVSLVGLEYAEIHRGDVLAPPGTLKQFQVFDALFSFAAPPSAPLSTAAPFANAGFVIGRRSRLTIHAATDQAAGRIVPIASVGEATQRLVRVVLRSPLVVAAGDRLVVRGERVGVSASSVVGGLEVLRLSPKKGRLRDAEPELRLILAAKQQDHVRAQLEVEASNTGGLLPLELAPRLASRGFGPEVTRVLMSQRLPSGRYVSNKCRMHAMSRLVELLGMHHQRHPDQLGLPRGSLTSQLSVSSELVDALIADHTKIEFAAPNAKKSVGVAQLVLADEYVRLSTFVPQASGDDPDAKWIAEQLRVARASPPSLGELAKVRGIDPARARILAVQLEKAKLVCHVEGDLWFAADFIKELEQKLVSHLTTHGSISTAGFKDLVGASRKFVMPLISWFDSQRVTLRVGDLRKLRG